MGSLAPSRVNSRELTCLHAIKCGVQQFLAQLDPHLYTMQAVHEAFEREPEWSYQLLEAVRAKFHPEQADPERYRQLATQLRAETRETVLKAAIGWVEATVKTNCYCNQAEAIGFRLQPSYFDMLPTDRFPERPYGLFFICADHFLGFHIRFRDLARGGLRTVFPTTTEQVGIECNQILAEAYNLALTQQHKNREIPEGGAKAVLFINWIEPQDAHHNEHLHACQRHFVTTLLQLVNCDESGALRDPAIRDYLGQPEYLYLGPDENMHDVMIDWIAEESLRRGYRPGLAFITGKSSAGINHKRYGVTSHGLHVYVEAALNELGIDPHTQPFRVKMSGGPDGDVAGNELLNLARYKTARLVALTDASGTIRDDEGLDLEVVQQLVDAGKTISHYPAARLSATGYLLDRHQWLHARDSKRQLPADQASELLRNSLHQTPADLFIPAGGRPRTLNDANWRDLLTPQGQPTARAIVEGANLYLTPEARRNLERLGVLIFKDSSANKGGVICSSYEVLCTLALGEELFLQNKSQLVTEILEIIATRCRQEATLLLEAHRTTDEPLTTLSDRLSDQMNAIKDRCLQEPLNPDLFLRFCPPLLRTQFAPLTLERVPEVHQRAAAAAQAAVEQTYVDLSDLRHN